MSNQLPLHTELKIHALNLAVSLHKDTFRFTFERDADPRSQVLTDETLLSAGRFLDWLRDPEPNLGLATTRELLEEIAARGMSQSSSVFGLEMNEGAGRLMSALPASMLDYRTVDG